MEKLLYTLFALGFFAFGIGILLQLPGTLNDYHHFKDPFFLLVASIVLMLGLLVFAITSVMIREGWAKQA